ncbi:hypothetical protein DPMN_151126 [Dreissena polymorpha]|uniref:Uncharacterized protein n=1 Tax=Dreissena polymorpha TaxID=45954 RepID=A0A9D4FEH8_DREPO|nr:hypothetical protein DPMN_151126 [Dreissena polymorpha]
MVNIGRHGDIKSADKPCLRLAHPERILRNSRAVNANGRGHEHVTQLITSDEETCNKRTVAKCSITAVDIPYNQTADTLARCKYSSESYTQCHCKGSVFETPSHDTYEAYLEIPQRDHRTSALRTLPPSLWQPKAINSHSKICISSNRTFTITLFYVLISLLLMCKSSVCLLCSNEDRLNQTSLSFGLSERPSYLGFIDRNKFPKIYSQCKPLTSNFVNDVCDIKLKSTISSRSMELRKLHTNFCGYPLVNVLSSEEIRRVTHCSKGDCLSVLQAVQYMDSELSDMFCQFTDVVNMIDCKEVFATLGNCDKCKVRRQFYRRFYFTK